MQVLIGRPVSPGFAEGNAVSLDYLGTVVIPKYAIAASKVPSEVERVHQALERSSRDIEALGSRVSSDLGAVHAGIFAAHLALLRDKGFSDRITGKICAECLNAEQATHLVVSELFDEMQNLGNSYLRDRAQDIRDIGLRVIGHLLNSTVQLSRRLNSASVIIARELLPSETIDLDREHVVAIVTEEGGENSHSAILARAMGIPAVTGVAGATQQIQPGTKVLVNGQSGQIALSPSPADIEAFRVQQGAFSDRSSAAVVKENLESISIDGKRISLLANINRPADADLVLKHHLDGVGLFRTEFMFLDQQEPPDFSRQLSVYREVIKKLNGRPLVIRTLDFGGDKIPRFLTAAYKANPTLGSRGLGFSLAHSDLFDTQLSAILAAANEFPQAEVRVLFPMVLDENDLLHAIDRVKVLATRGGYNRLPAIGAMIEAPSSLFCLEQILSIAEFVSIGTNDLTQFLLAADRRAADMADNCSAVHPAVLRAIRSVVDACDKSGRELCVCGEAAGDSATACLLIGLGVRQLSVSPRRAARVRLAIRHSKVSHLKALAEQAMHSGSCERVRALLVDFENGLESNQAG